MRGAVEVWSLVTGRVVIPGEKQDQGWNAGHDGVCFGFVEFGPLSNIHVMTCSQGAKERSQAQRQGFRSGDAASQGHYGTVLWRG